MLLQQESSVVGPIDGTDKCMLMPRTGASVQRTAFLLSVLEKNSRVQCTECRHTLQNGTAQPAHRADIKQCWVLLLPAMV